MTVPGRRPQLAVATLAVLLAAADTYVVVVALPAIATGVGISLDQIARAEPVISGFLLGYCALLPLVGRLSDRTGRVPVLLGCLAVFCLGSAFTSTAHGLPLLLAGRGLQGLGAGGLVPATLGLVADRWTVRERGLPLGVVGAAQELGALSGPLLGAGLLALTSWRGIFVVNLVAGVVLAVVIAVVGRVKIRRDLPGSALLVVLVAAGGLYLAAPSSLVDDVTLGAIYVPVTGTSALLSPLGLVMLASAVLLALRGLLAHASVLPLRGLVGHLRALDSLGALLLTGALTCVILACSPADPTTAAVARSWLPLLGAALLFAVAFVLRQRRAREPLLELPALRPPPAWGALVVSLLVGAVLIAVLVEVPLFARLTAYPSSQTGAALVLVRFLALVPVGAFGGGWLLGRIGPGPIAAGGMLLASGTVAAMSRWGASALGGGPRVSDVVLALAGLGVGLAVAPVNAGLLAAIRPGMHGTASALVVVARTVGQLVGLSALSAIGLHVFVSRLADVGPAAQRCAAGGGGCGAYADAVREAGIAQQHAVLASAAVCALLAAGLALLLGLRRPESVLARS